MSMRINSLFKHDAQMKFQAEGDNQNIMPSTIFEEEAPEAQEVPAPKSNSGKSEKGRHRAGIACASCRDRRIKVRGPTLSIEHG
jgi:hypothetical protein